MYAHAHKNHLLVLRNKKKISFLYNNNNKKESFVTPNHTKMLIIYRRCLSFLDFIHKDEDDMLYICNNVLNVILYFGLISGFFHLPFNEKKK